MQILCKGTKCLKTAFLAVDFCHESTTFDYFYPCFLPYVAPKRKRFFIIPSG